MASPSTDDVLDLPIEFAGDFDAAPTDQASPLARSCRALRPAAEALASTVSCGPTLAPGCLESPDAVLPSSTSSHHSNRGQRLGMPPSALVHLTPEHPGLTHRLGGSPGSPRAAGGVGLRSQRIRFVSPPEHQWPTDYAQSFVLRPARLNNRPPGPAEPPPALALRAGPSPAFPLPAGLPPAFPLPAGLPPAFPLPAGPAPAFPLPAGLPPALLLFAAPAKTAAKTAAEEDGRWATPRFGRGRSMPSHASPAAASGSRSGCRAPLLSPRNSAAAPSLLSVRKGLHLASPKTCKTVARTQATRRRKERKIARALGGSPGSSDSESDGGSGAGGLAASSPDLRVPQRPAMGATPGDSREGNCRLSLLTCLGSSTAAVQAQHVPADDAIDAGGEGSGGDEGVWQLWPGDGSSPVAPKAAATGAASGGAGANAGSPMGSCVEGDEGVGDEAGARSTSTSPASGASSNPASPARI